MCPVQVFNPIFGMNGTDNKLNAKPSFLLQLSNVRENIDIKFDPPTMCLFLMLSTYYMKPWHCVPPPYGPSLPPQGKTHSFLGAKVQAKAALRLRSDSAAHWKTALEPFQTSTQAHLIWNSGGGSVFHS